jgi:hypothetical protein
MRWGGYVNSRTTPVIAFATASESEVNRNIEVPVITVRATAYSDIVWPCSTATLELSQRTRCLNSCFTINSHVRGAFFSV